MLHLYRYLYFTVLRDPVQRYISEWKHVQRGSTWISAKLMCNGRQATLQEVPFCFKGRLTRLTAFLPRDAICERAISRRRVSVRPSVRRSLVLYQNG